VTGAELRALRLSLGLTQAELGAQIGVGYQTICQWEQSDVMNRIAALAVGAVQPRVHKREKPRTGPRIRHTLT